MSWAEGSRPGRMPRAALGLVVLGLVVAAVMVFRARSTHQFSVRAPTPIEGGPAVQMNELSPSVFSIPVRVALHPLVEVVEASLPRQFGDIEDRRTINGRDNLEGAFEAQREDIRATFTDSTVTLSTTLAYRARAWYDPPILPVISASCGTGENDPQPRLAVTLTTPLTLDPEWRLRTKIAAGPIRPATEDQRDRCTVTFLDFDMTDEVVGAARDLVVRMGPRADSAIAALDVRRQFQEWWDIIAEPVRLADDVWLLLTPEAVGRGPIHGTGDGIETTLTMRARPRVVISPSIPEVEASQIPPLESIEPGDGLRIFAEAQADYAELAGLLRNELGDRDLTAGGRKLRIRSVTILGVGDGRISVALRVSGDVAGDLYLVGTPVYDGLTGQIAVPDLDFDVGTREALVAGAAWVARVGLVESFREKARWPSAPAVDWARAQVQAGFNSRLSDEVRLEGQVDTVSVVGVHAGTTSLRIRAEVRGRARLVVEQRGGG